VDAIANLAEVKSAGLTQSGVTEFIEDFCSNRMPWALNALRGYIGTLAPNQLAESWLTKWSAMMHFGLPSPKAAIFYALGLRSREAAACCACNCAVLAESPELHQWLIGLPDEEITQWPTIDRVRQEIISFRDQLRTSELWRHAPLA